MKRQFVKHSLLVLSQCLGAQAAFSQGLGFGIDFTITNMTPEMEQNNPLLPQCDVKELRENGQTIECRQGWLRGIAPESVRVSFPGLTASDRVLFYTEENDGDVIGGLGNSAFDIVAGERQMYNLRIERGTSETFDFKVAVIFYPVAP